MNKENKRKLFLANKLHREIFVIFLCAAIIPTLITTVLLFYLIFYIVAQQFVFPEAIAYNIIPAAQQVMTILLILTPISILIILKIANTITSRIIGPFDRIVSELDQCIKGEKRDNIVIRDKDKFLPLVDKINILLDKLRVKG